MASNKMFIDLHLVWWFYCGEFGYFTIDEPCDELEGIVHQLCAEDLEITNYS